MAFNDENIQETPEQNVEETQNQEAVVDENPTEQPVEAQQEKDWKAEYEKAQKSYKEIQSLYGKASNEIGDLRKFRKEMEPYVEYLKQQSELEKQQRYQQNPQLQMQEYLEAQLQPVREYQAEMQSMKTVQTLQSELGEETYSTLAPVMANVLRYYQENEPQVAEYLAGNPVALVRQAAGDYYLYQMSQQKQQASQAKANRQVAQKAMTGVARGSVAPTNKTNSDFGSMDLDAMKNQLRKMGAAIRPE